MQQRTRTALLPLAAIVLLGTGLLLARWLSGHSEPPPPPPPPPRDPVHVSDVDPNRWSWLHWWEANRLAYLSPLVQVRNAQARDAEGAAEIRARAVAALVKGLTDPATEVRSQCALALGLMREAGALPPLQAVAANDPDESTRVHALLAIGLIGTPQALAFLTGRQYPSDLLLTAAIFGVGLAEDPPEGELRKLQQLAGGRSPMSHAAVWSLRQHPGRALAVATQNGLGIANPWTASETLLAAAHSTNRNIQRGLAQTASGKPRGLAGWELLEQVAKAKGVVIAEATTPGGRPVPQLLQAWLVAHNRLFERMPRVAPPAPVLEKMVGGIEGIYQGRLQASAAIALGQIEEPGAVQALRAMVASPVDDDTDLPRSMAAIGLGRLGQPDALPDLLAIVDSAAARQAQQSSKLETPVRGCAAIGLGLYARPVETAQGSSDRPGYETALDLLFARLTDPREEIELRCACAVSIGLSRRTAALKPLVQFAGTLNRDDMLLAGYAIMARAMLGDTNVVDPARNLMNLPAHRDEATDLLARRAVVLALGLSGRRDAVPILVSWWDAAYYVNREVILALALTGAVGASDDMLPDLEGAGNLYVRAYMARIVGRLYAPWPSPLAGFLVDSDYYMRNELMLPYRRLVNEFLVDYLVPQFEERWY